MTPGDTRSMLAGPLCSGKCLQHILRNIELSSQVVRTLLGIQYTNYSLSNVRVLLYIYSQQLTLPRAKQDQLNSRPTAHADHVRFDLQCNTLCILSTQQQSSGHPDKMHKHCQNTLVEFDNLNSLNNLLDLCGFQIP